MRKRSGRALAWWIAAAMTAVMMLAVLAFADVRFGTNDDAPILRAFMGYEAGTPESVTVTMDDNGQLSQTEIVFTYTKAFGFKYIWFVSCICLNSCKSIYTFYSFYTPLNRIFRQKNLHSHH